MRRRSLTITPRQRDVFWVIARMLAESGAPTIKEIAARLGIGAPAAMRLVVEIEANGYLASTPGKWRSLRLTDAGRALLGAAP